MNPARFHPYLVTVLAVTMLTPIVLLWLRVDRTPPGQPITEPPALPASDA